MAEEVSRVSSDTSTSLGSRTRGPADAEHGPGRQVALTEERQAVLVRRIRARAVSAMVAGQEPSPTFTSEQLLAFIASQSETRDVMASPGAAFAPSRAATGEQSKIAGEASLGDVLATLLRRTGRRIAHILGVSAQAKRGDK